MPATEAKINHFTGLNTRDAPARIKDTELVECQNFNMGRSGELVKRTGMVQLAQIGGSNQPVRVLGLFQTSTFSQIMARVGNDLYYSTDGTTWNLIAGGPYNNVEFGIQYVNNFYMVRNNSTMLQWDGTSLTVISGSPSGTFARIYKDRMFVINSINSGLESRIYYSKPADFTTSGWASLGTFIDIQPGDGDVCIAAAMLHDNFIIFKQFSSWILYTAADPSAWVLRNLSPEIGCVSKYTPREIEGQLYFVGPRGVYKTDGYSFQELSSPVQPIFPQQILGSSAINQTFAAWWEDKYIVVLQTFAVPPTWGSLKLQTWSSLASQPWDAQNATYTWLVYHLRTESWTHWLPAVAENMSPFTFAEVRGPASIRGLYIGSRNLDGKVFRYGDPVYKDGVGSNFDCIIESKDFDFDEPVNVKRGKFVAVERSGVGAITLTHIADGVPQAPETVTFGNTLRNSVRAPGPGFFRTWRFRTLSAEDLPHVFYGVTLIVSPRPVAKLGA